MEQLFDASNSSKLYNQQPSFESVVQFFHQSNCPKDEAEVFYFYYASLDWKTEEGTSIRNWVPFAKEWISNLSS